MADRDRGLYEKFTVRRTDGSDAVGFKHRGCEYFVLDLTHDKYAVPASHFGLCQILRRGISTTCC